VYWVYAGEHPSGVRLAELVASLSLATDLCLGQPQGRYLVCPICVDAKQIDKGDILPNAEIGGTV
jgi:hypothetical protein